MLGLVMSGARDIRWLNARLQAIVDEPKPHERLGITLDTYRAEVEFWESEFPENGPEIVEILGPFLSPCLELGLQPPSAGLVERALIAGRRTVRWESEISQVQLEHAWQPANNPSKHERCLSEKIITILCVLPPAESEDWHRVTKPIYEKLLQTLTAGGVLGQIKQAMSRARPSEEALTCLSGELVRQLALAVICQVRGYKDRDVRPLLAFWRAGHFPWASRGGRLCVLCQGLQ